MSLPPTEPSRQPESPESSAEFQQHVRDYSRAARRWMWSSLNRDSLVAGIKTMTWLVPLTLLIWVYAERQQTDTTTIAEIIPFQLRVDDPKKLAYPGISDRSISTRLSGPKGRIGDVREEIARRGVDNRLALIIDKNLKPGTYDLSTEQLLSQTDIFVKYGVVAVFCKPETIPVVVDEYDEREAEVQPLSAKNLAEPPIFTPATVMVRAPHNAMPADPKLVVYFDFAGDSSLDIPGPHEATKKVSTSRPSGDYVSFSPLLVKATYNVRQSDTEYKIPSVVIWDVFPEAFQEKYHVVHPALIPNVTVIGPPEKIELLKSELLKSNPLAVQALLQVKPEDADGATHTGPLRYVFADGLEGIVASKDARHTIEYTVVAHRAE